MNNLVPFTFWLATAIYFVCAYPMSPPDIVKGFSSFHMAQTLFVISTCCLIIHTFSLGKSCRGCGPKRRRIKRWAYTLLCATILYAFMALNHVVKLGPTESALPLIMLHGIACFALISLFFAMRYWHEKTQA
jgi:hypothetical protein